MPQSLTLRLRQSDNVYHVDDPPNSSVSHVPPGRWQHEGGRVHCADHGKLIGDYIVYRRVTFSGAEPQNTAMLTMTLFFRGEHPPQNITLQGSHDFSSGNYIGSVSAASSRFAGVRGQSFSGVATTLGESLLTIEGLGEPGVNPC